MRVAHIQHSPTLPSGVLPAAIVIEPEVPNWIASAVIVRWNALEHARVGHKSGHKLTSKEIR
jgi:hypothetical protein